MSLSHRRLLRRLAARARKAKPQVITIGGGLPSEPSEDVIEVRNRHGVFCIVYGLPPLRYEQKDKREQDAG
jgi:hypothetical protein